MGFVCLAVFITLKVMTGKKDSFFLRGAMLSEQVDFLLSPKL